MVGSPAHVCVFPLAFLALVMLFACAGFAGSTVQVELRVCLGRRARRVNLFANACGASAFNFDLAKGGTRQRRSRHCTLTLAAARGTF